MSTETKPRRKISHQTLRYSVKMASVPKIIWIDDFPTLAQFNSDRRYYRRLINKAVDKLFKEKSWKTSPEESIAEWLSRPSKPKRIKRGGD